MLLQGFTRHIQWQVIRIHNTFDEAQVLWHHVLEVVSDEYPAYIHLNCYGKVYKDAKEWQHDTIQIMPKSCYLSAM